MLQWDEDAHTACRWIDRTCKRDHQQQRVIIDDRHGDTGGDHQAGGGQEQAAEITARTEESDRDCQECRAGERCGRDDAHLQRRKSQSKQIDRQQNGDEPVAKIA